MIFKMIPQGHCLIVERFRKPVKVVPSGPHFFIPILDQAKNVRSDWNVETNKEGVYIELSEQITDTKPRPYYTSDNVQVFVDCMYRWRIIDPLAAVYEVDHLHVSLREVILAEIRSFVGSHDLNFILTSRKEISEHVVATVSSSLKKWGVQLLGADIQDITLDTMTRDTMRQQLEASRESEARKLSAAGKAESDKTLAEGHARAIERLAEAERYASIARADGESQGQMMMSDGEQTYLQVLVDAIGQKAAAKVFLAQKAAESYTRIAAGSATKVYMENAMMPTLDMIGNKTER